MRKFSFLVVTCAIAMFTAVISSCNKTKAPEIPDGTAIGNVKYFIGEDSLVKFVNIDENGTKEVKETMYSSLELNDSGFLVATEGEKLALLSLDGKFFAYAESYEVKPYFAVSADEKPALIVLTKVPGNGNHLAFDIATRGALISIGGLNEEIIPLSNGVTLFKQKAGWGFAGAKAELATLNELKAIAVVTAKGKTYYWVQTQEYSGFVDAEGNEVKRMNAAALKALKKKGKLLWENEDKTVFGVEVNRI